MPPTVRANTTGDAARVGAGVARWVGTAVGVGLGVGVAVAVGVAVELAAGAAACAPQAASARAENVISVIERIETTDVMSAS
jgi:hypothetical protein